MQGTQMQSTKMRRNKAPQNHGSKAATAVTIIRKIEMEDMNHVRS